MSDMLQFEKIHACGNDFVLMDVPPTLDLLARLCDRNHGIGADGVMIWRVDNDLILMDHYDPDGSRSLCLNGTRSALGCLAAQRSIPTEGRVVSEGQSFDYTVNGSSVCLALPLKPFEARNWENSDCRVEGFYCDVGNPHFVICDSLAQELLPKVAPEIRHDIDNFPDGTNVHLVWWTDEFWRIRSYERGVEGFTLACGSGMYAAALVTMEEEMMDEIIFSPDGQGTVTFQRDGDELRMTGDVAWVASGVLRC